MSEKTFEFDNQYWLKVVDLDKAPADFREDVLYLILIAKTLIMDNDTKTAILVDNQTYVQWEPQNSEGFIYSVGWDRVLGFDFMGSYYRVYSDPQGVAEVAARFRRRFVLDALADV